MPSFDREPRAILLSISKLSGEHYLDVGGQDLIAELHRRGFDCTMAQLIRIMRSLEAAGYLSCSYLGGMSGVELIRLEHRGRQEVEGWPTVPGELSEPDITALIAALELRAEDPQLPDAEKGKARAAATAVKDLGVSVGAQVLSAWLRHLAGLG